MHKCYVRVASADDVAVVLRDAQVRGVLVLAPLPGSDWTGVVRTDDAALDDLAPLLTEWFGNALRVSADAQSWTMDLIGETALEIDASQVSRDDARKTAQQVSRALGLPRITTALERLMRRPLAGAAALERLGEALDLSACGRTADEIRSDGRTPHLRVEEGRIIGRVAGSVAGAGYTHVRDLIEDTVVDLLDRGRTDAALRQLRGYDIHLRVEDGALACRAPEGLVTAGLREGLARHKQAITDRLS